jgi:methyl-accepting chemotaxis protein/methyl-accepting chemotaxis protein-1 (serine sensor receptor)
LFSDWTFLQKLTAGVVLMMLCLVGLSYSSWRSISRLGNALDESATNTASRLTLLGATKSSFLEMKSESQGMQVRYAIQELDRQGRSGKSGQVYCLSCHTPENAEETAGRFESESNKVKKQAADLQLLMDDQISRQAVDEFNSGAGEWIGSTKEYLALADHGQFAAAHTILTDKTFPIVKRMEKASDLLGEREQKTIATFRREAKANIQSSRIITLIFIFINLGCSVLLLMLVLSMSRKLQRMSVEINQGAQQLASAAEQVSGASQSLAQGASEQAAALEETTSSTAEINSRTSRNADHSKSAANMMTATTNRIAAGNRKLDEMIASMAEIKAFGEKIGKIIKTIDEIAFQTNILALNAAVEAARAGKSGMGFAVVADEVRNLAQRCAQAAKDTANLIHESIASTHDGGRKLSEVSEAIAAVTEEAEKVKTLIEEVSLGSQEQTVSLGQVSRALEQMELVTQRTASGAEEGAAAGQQLCAQSQILSEIAHRLNEFVGVSQ